MRSTADHYEIELAPDLNAPEQARRALEVTEAHLPPGLFDDVVLLVNELVTNSVKFAGRGPIGLKLISAPDAVRVEVRDAGPGFAPGPIEPELTDTSGRGLFLVDALADRWGVSLDGATCVWFEIGEVAGAA